MPLECAFKQRHGRQFCVTDCPASAPCGIFEYVRIERARGRARPPDPRTIDVAVLDMNHGWPNLGHDSLVHAVMDASCEATAALEDGRAARAGALVRRAPLGRAAGGAGAAATRSTWAPAARATSTRARTTACAPESQGIREDPAWEEPAFRLFDAIRRHDEAALLAVCHTFGVLCRWSGAAEPVLRGPEKGKCSGVLENVLALARRPSTPGSAASPSSWDRARGCASSRTASST